MNVYFKLDDYRQNFASYGKTVKAQGSDDFSTAASCYDLRSDEAFYLYGGRKALIEALEDNRLRIRNDTPGGNQPLAVFHDKVSVDGGKKKRVIMIAQRSDDRIRSLSNKVLADPQKLGSIYSNDLIKMIKTL